MSHEDSGNSSSDDDDIDWSPRALNYEKDLSKDTLNHIVFANELSADRLQNDPNLHALQSLIYDETTPLERAQTFKENGNEAFKAKTPLALQNAAVFYSRALDEKFDDDKLRALLLSNRAQCQIGLQNYGHGLEDCERALALDPACVKARMRAVLASQRIRRWDKVMEHSSAALELPNLGPVDRSHTEAALSEAKRESRLQELAAEKARQKQRRRTSMVRRFQLAGIAVGPRVFDDSQIQGGEYDFSASPLISSKETGIDELSLRIQVPCLILYEDCKRSDLLQSIGEDDLLLDHLQQLFPVPWDPASRIYALSSVRFFFLSSQTGRFVPFDVQQQPALTFGDVFRKPGFFLQDVETNGLCVFHVIPASADAKEALKLFLASAPGHAIPLLPPSEDKDDDL